MFHLTPDYCHFSENLRHFHFLQLICNDLLMTGIKKTSLDVCRTMLVSWLKLIRDSCSLIPSLNLLKLNDVIELHILSFVYQWSHRLLPPCFSENFKFTSSVHSYSTRQSSNRNLYLASVNTTQYGLRSLKFTGPRLWNSLPTSLTTSNSLRIFRKTLKNSMLNCYSI